MVALEYELTRESVDPDRMCHASTLDRNKDICKREQD